MSVRHHFVSITKLIMEIKTYGVYGLTDWQGKVKAGTIEANLHFTGGTSSQSGTQPAYLVTKDPVKQFVIENSKEFKSGFIKLVMRQEVPGTHQHIAAPKPAKVTKSTVGVNPPPTPAQPVPTQEHETAQDIEAEEVNPAEESTTTEDGKAIIDVTDIDDAREYLSDNFGVAKSALRSNVSVARCAEEHNIVLRYPE